MNKEQLLEWKLNMQLSAYHCLSRYGDGDIDVKKKLQANIGQLCQEIHSHEEKPTA